MGLDTGIPEQERHYVYAMLCQDGDGPGYVKFGHSTRIGQRLSTLRLSCPIPARYFAISHVGPYRHLMFEAEKTLHKAFRNRRITGEWFKFDFSSLEDKREFNDKTNFVLRQICGVHYEGWTRISVKALDEHQRQRRFVLLNGKQRKRVIAKWKRKTLAERNQREMAVYRSGLHA